MALPKLNAVLYDLTLPYSKRTIQYRPFVIGEQKIMMIAMETKDPSQIFSAMKQAIQACTNNTIDVSKLPLFELEYIFLNIRMKSVGEKTRIMLACGECLAENEVEVDLRETKFFQPDETKKDNVIFLTDKLAVRMNIPNMEMLQRIDNSRNKNAEDTQQTELLFEIVLESIDAILDEENEYKIDDSNKGELKEFVESLTTEQFIKIQDFLNNVPILKLDVKHKCEKCNHDMSTELEGINNFF